MIELVNLYDIVCVIAGGCQVLHGRFEPSVEVEAVEVEVEEEPVEVEVV